MLIVRARSNLSFIGKGDLRERRIDGYKEAKPKDGTGI
jgi:hypothetical protein